VSLSRRLRGFLKRVPFNRRAPGGHAEGANDLETVPSSAARRLQARSDLVARQLGRSGLRTRRLESQQVAELLHRCWSPELARVQRLREELGAYTTLVVGSRRLARPPLDRDLAQCGVAASGADGEAEGLFALGTRRLADLIAPSGCEVRADHLRLDGHYARVLVVTGYPPPGHARLAERAGRDRPADRGQPARGPAGLDRDGAARPGSGASGSRCLGL
jgi:hypothetical protein